MDVNGRGLDREVLSSVHKHSGNYQSGRQQYTAAKCLELPSVCCLEMSFQCEPLLSQADGCHTDSIVL